MRPSQSSSSQRHASKTPAKINIIGGQWKRTPLPVLSLPGLRPTPNRARETLFNWLGNRLDGWRCLDLFAGSGALGFEAASRGAAHVVMVEQDPRAIKQLRATQQKLQADMIHIVQGDALSFAARLPAGSLDMVFLDPPFLTFPCTTNTSSNPNHTSDALSKVLVQAIQCAWNAVRKGGVIYVEAPIEINDSTWIHLLANDSIQRTHQNDTLPLESLSTESTTPFCPLTHYKGFGAVHAHLLRR